MTFPSPKEESRLSALIAECERVVERAPRDMRLEDIRMLVSPVHAQTILDLIDTCRRQQDALLAIGDHPETPPAVKAFAVAGLVEAQRRELLAREYPSS